MREVLHHGAVVITTQRTALGLLATAQGAGISSFNGHKVPRATAAREIANRYFWGGPDASGLEEFLTRVEPIGEGRFRAFVVPFGKWQMANGQMAKEAAV